MIRPPTNSARVSCQPSNRAMMMPSSMTRLVEAISKVKPRMSDQAICQAIPPAASRAWPRAWSTVTQSPRTWSPGPGEAVDGFE